MQSILFQSLICYLHLHTATLLNLSMRGPLNGRKSCATETTFTNFMRTFQINVYYIPTVVKTSCHHQLRYGFPGMQ